MAQSILYVNPATGKDTGVGNLTAPLKSLTKALSVAASGTTIQLEKGTYNTATGEVFPIVIPVGVMVLGNEPSLGKSIVIEGSGQYISPTLGSQNITLRLEMNAQLRGVTVTNRTATGTGVWIESTSVTLANNTFTACGREGVLVTGTGKPIIIDNRFFQNSARGLSLVRNAKGEVRRNVLEKTGYAIAIGDLAAPLVSDNKITANSMGIVLSRQVRPVLRRNLIEKNTIAGLVVTEEARPDLGSIQDGAGNILRDNGQFDLQNSTTFKLVSAGNQLNPSRVQGQVEFIAAEAGNFLVGPTQFSDIGGHWAELFIQRLLSRGLVNGFPDGTFKPQANINRAQFAAMIFNTFDLPLIRRDVVVFKDVKSDFWAAKAIQKVAQMGFIYGFPDQTFRPAQNVTRVQAIAAIAGGLGLTGGNLNLLSFYQDRAQIPSYATNGIAIATQKRLVVNYPKLNLLEPMRDMTRGEVAALIVQALVATGKETAIASPYIVTADPSLPSFTDIQGHWAENFIRVLTNQNFMRGFADGSFKPEEKLTRAQLASLLVTIFNPSAKLPPTQFTDVAADFWASAVIEQAYRGGFMSGFPDQTFRPNQNVLKVQMIVSLANALSLPQGDEQFLSRYEDRDAIPSYARAMVAAATQKSLVVNYPVLRQLNPNGETTRALSAAMIYQALVSIGRLPAIKSAYIVS